RRLSGHRRKPQTAARELGELDDEGFWAAYEVAKPCSMLHIPGFFNIWQSVKHVAGMQVPGGFVECGCCLGGSSIFLVLTRDAFALEDRRIDVFDTFAGFPRDSIYSLARPSKRGLSLASYYDTVRENFE